MGRPASTDGARGQLQGWDVSRKALGPPCPHCERPLTARAAAKLNAKTKREGLGPNRLAAVETSQDGWCAICDELPIKEAGEGRRGIYTCAREACKRAWGNLCALDQRIRNRSAA